MQFVVSGCLYDALNTNLYDSRIGVKIFNSETNQINISNFS